MVDADALAWAQAQPAASAGRALADAVLAGTSEVRFADGSAVRYRTTAEIGAALAALHAAARGAQRRPAATVARVGGDW